MDTTGLIGHYIDLAFEIVGKKTGGIRIGWDEYGYAPRNKLKQIKLGKQGDIVTLEQFHAFVAEIADAFSEYSQGGYPRFRFGQKVDRQAREFEKEEYLKQNVLARPDDWEDESEIIKLNVYYDNSKGDDTFLIIENWF